MPSDDYDDDVKRIVYEIHGDVKEINQHLETLNGKVARHEEDLGELDERTKSNQNKIKFATGIAVTVSTAAAVAASYLGGLIG